MIGCSARAATIGAGTRARAMARAPLLGGDGADVLRGGGAIDALAGGAGADDLSGGGDARRPVRRHGAGRPAAGQGRRLAQRRRGIDTVSADTSAVTAGPVSDLADGALARRRPGWAGRSVAAGGIENLRGSPFNDLLIGDAGAERAARPGQRRPPGRARGHGRPAWRRAAPTRASTARCSPVVSSSAATLGPTPGNPRREPWSWSRTLGETPSSSVGRPPCSSAFVTAAAYCSPPARCLRSHRRPTVRALGAPRST